MTQQDTRPKVWTSAEAVRLTGASYRQIDYWHRCGWLGTDTAKGSGTHRTISAEQLQRIQILKAADLAGLTIHVVVSLLNATGYDPDCLTFTLPLSAHVEVTIAIEAIA